MNFTIKNIKCPSWNEFTTGNWRKTHRAKQELQNEAHWQILEQLHGEKLEIKESVHMSITAHYRGKRKHDPDNLFVKPLIDAIVCLGILPDDNGDVIQSLTLATKNGAKEDVIFIDIF